jgi:hypothetical protein
MGRKFYGTGAYVKTGKQPRKSRRGKREIMKVYELINFQKQ